jgi:hypothetical protein
LSHRFRNQELEIRQKGKYLRCVIALHAAYGFS